MVDFIDYLGRIGHGNLQARAEYDSVDIDIRSTYTHMSKIKIKIVLTSE